MIKSIDSLKFSYIIILVILVGLSGCYIDGEVTTDQLVEEQNTQAIEAYLDANGLNAQKTETGIYYVVDSNFIGSDLEIYKYTEISYTAKLLDGTTIDMVTESNPFELFVDSSGGIVIYNDRVAATGIAIATGFLKLNQTGLFIMDAGIAYGTSSVFIGSEGVSVSSNTPIVFEIKALTSKSEDDLIEEYINSNNLSPVALLPSGVRYIKTVAGTGADSTGKTTFFVKYEGKFLDGEVFDRNQTGNFSFQKDIGQVISGFEEATLGMQIGDKVIAILPHITAYGAQGSGTSILPYTPIVFELELINAE